MKQSDRLIIDALLGHIDEWEHDPEKSGERARKAIAVEIERKASKAQLAAAPDVDFDELRRLTRGGDFTGLGDALFGPPRKALAWRNPTGVMRAVKWLWPGWLAKGKVTLFAGVGGVGKGTLLAYLVACATGSRPWPDKTLSPAGKALIISLDDDEEDTLWPRLHFSGCQRERVMLPEKRGIPDWREVAELCRKTEDLALVYIDIMEAGLSSKKSGNAASDVSEHMGRFVEIAAGSGAAVVVVAHTNKSATESIRDGNLAGAVRGSGAWVDAVRMCWLYCLDATDENKSRILARVKCNLPVDWQDGAWRFSSGLESYTDGDGAVGEIFVVRTKSEIGGNALDILRGANPRKTALDDDGESNAGKARRLAAELLADGAEMRTGELIRMIRMELGISDSTARKALDRWDGVENVGEANKPMLRLRTDSG